MLTEKPLVSILELQHEEYAYFRNTWQTISDIREGATTIEKKVEEYLPIRPGESRDIYKLRLAKMSWTPVMSTAIREFVVKLLAAPLHIEGAEGDFWERFKNDTNGKGRDESDLLVNIFSSLLYYGKVYVAVDRPVLTVQPRSLFEERAVGALPKIVLYEPLAVTNWSNGWTLTREVATKSQPLEKPVTIVTWRIWDNTAITTYEAEVKTVDEAIMQVKVNGYWFPMGSPEATATQVSVVNHGLNSIPIVMAKLKPELWTGNNCYLKQLQHFRIESSWTDAGVMAGTIQRVFTPTPPVNTSDPSYVPEEQDFSDLKSDNAHVLIGNGFQFVESPGTAIASLTGQLETIENQIRAIVSMTSSAVDKSKAVASGEAKAIDNEPLEDTMKSYGKKMASFYQDILRLVAKVANRNLEIAVNGLDSYNGDTLEEMLAHSVLLKANAEVLPKTALKLWYGKLSNLIAGSRSASIDETIIEELNALWDGELPAAMLPPPEEPTTP